MGASFGGVVIKTNPSCYDSLDVLKYFEQQEFFELQSSELSGFWFDTRKDDCFKTYKTKDSIWIVNQSIAEMFFGESNESIIQEFYNYFDHPDLIVAFNEYDTTSTYGFAVIEKGKLIRVRRSVRFDTTLDVGIPLPQEEKWMQAKTFTEYVDDRPILCYQDPKDENRAYGKEGLTQVILSELTQDYFGFPTWDTNLAALETRYFKVGSPNTAPHIDKVSNRSWLKKIFGIS